MPKVEKVVNNQIETDNNKAKNLIYVIDDPDGYANVRISPNGDIIGQVDDGSSIDVIDQSGDWWKVKFAQDEEGFIHKSRIKTKE